MTDIVKIYNPSNASLLTPDQIEGLQKLTSDQIKELAKAYPNMSMNRAYLLIIDSTKPIDKQIPALNTFENLWNLREKNAQRKWVAYNFKGNYQSKIIPHVKAKRTEVRDLSDEELLTLPGFKTPQTGTMNMPETVKVTKIKKVKDALHT